MNHRPIVFIYYIYGKLKALSEHDAKLQHDNLIKHGWIHTKTLDATDYIEMLYRCPMHELHETILDLTKP